MKKPEVSESSPFRHAQADDSPGFLLWKLTALWQRKLGGIFDAFALTQTQFAILASLLWFERQHEPPTQARLVEHAKIDKMTLSKAIRKLEEAGLVNRESSTSDTRAIQVRFTVAGRKLIHQAIIAIERADDEFFSCLTEGQIETYKALTLAIIAGNNP
ncbi:MarR family winged helix-turn-helix transcriptional regulator [Ferrovum myxofaciens]|uniref:MarR family winged helix-turn-helix transcriptional regulator n=1 Tax=Ferrovum myxofaciens TaxID=416213 RepID=UPI002356498F|nr:MarR family transcriptional regulator [Ferrovum myxofaciens]MBU6993517.1 MarR family transcriptional regulator [Ferrovum myxofaciens]